MPQVIFAASDGNVRATMNGQAKGLDGVAAASRRAAAAERERAAATHAAARAHGHASGSRQTALIGRLVGGEGGALLRHGAHFSHLSGGFMAAGVAAIALGVTFKALSAASERAVEAAREEAKIRLELNHAMKTATRAADASAIGAYKTDKEAIDTLVATGGDSAVERAKRLTRFGPDAIKGAGLLAGKGKFSEDNIGVAIAAAKTGRMSFADAAQAIAAGNVSANGSEDERAAQLLSGHLNQSITAGDVRSFTANRQSSIYGTRGIKVGEQDGDKVDASLDRFKTSDSLFAHGKEEIDAIRDPSGAAQYEVSKKLQEQIEIQREAAAAQNRIVAGIETLVGLFGGGGSEMDKLNRMTQAAQVVH